MNYVYLSGQPSDLNFEAYEARLPIEKFATVSFWIDDGILKEKVFFPFKIAVVRGFGVLN